MQFAEGLDGTAGKQPKTARANPGLLPSGTQYDNMMNAQDVPTNPAIYATPSKEHLDKSEKFENDLVSRFWRATLLELG
jgi:hypothetical protein